MRDGNIEAEKEGSSFIPAEFQIPAAAESSDDA
jgi:hypothetical protein